VAEAARADGVTSLVVLPVYPLCGASTTVAALASLRKVLDEMAWDVPVHEVAGWHRHPLYVAIRSDGVRASAAAAALDLNDPRARLLFSAHGTPLRYLVEGNRYDRYVTESCAAIARDAGVAEYMLGFQNHGNRPIEWTQPTVEDVVAGAAADALVVVPLSFMHEQSETLAELDGELRERVESRGIAFHRVPVPHDDPRFRVVLADLVEAGLSESGDARGIALTACRCRPGARCLNGE
jgi:ferrochelatase